MAQIQAKCPKCGEWQKIKNKTCIGGDCGYALGKRSKDLEYRLDYRDPDGKRVREKIGQSKAAAEQALRKLKNDMAEGRYIRKSPDAKTTLEELVTGYVAAPKPKIKNRDAYDRDMRARLKNLLPFFGSKLLKDITPELIKQYQQKRLSEPSGRSPKNLTKPATVNRELACLKVILNWARDNGQAESYPFKRGHMLRENNERDRVLSPEEYARLLAKCPDHVKPIVNLAYFSGMRQGEILSLTWGQVDLKEGFIKLNPEHCKTSEGRLVPLNLELIEMFEELRAAVGGVPMPGVKVFTYAGRSVGSIKRAFETAVRKAGIDDFTFHDLRHTALNNWRLQGHDYFRIMAASGHKTMSVFKRYNTVSKEELKILVEG